MPQSHRPVVAAIVAMAENRTIGRDNKLPWHLPADLKHFKELTKGKAIIMGRKTYDSIGKPLPNRTNIILTRDAALKIAGCHVVSSIDEAMRVAEAEQRDEIFIIGGAEVYRQLLPDVDRLYLTIVHHPIEGDAFFPDIDRQAWHEVSRERHEADEKNQYAYSFVMLERK